jgi:hypothetical protein
MKKITILLLIMCVCLSFGLLMSCDGSSGGSDDNGSTNGDNGGNGGDNGGENEDPPAVTWPVKFRGDNPALEDGYMVIEFYENGTFTVGVGGTVDGEFKEAPAGGGDYDGLDPHEDGTITMSGTFMGTPFNDSFTITDGVLPFEVDLVRQ